MAPSIVFDFDGTLALGHGPVRAYAQAIAGAAQPGFLDRVAQALVTYDTGDSGYRDGYHVVGALAAADGVSPAALQDAYARSRDMLGTPHAPVATIPRLPDFLATLGRSARLILATNAPAPGIDTVLESWGVSGRFDEVHVSVGKPDGLHRLIGVLREAGPVLAIGDIAEFDLAPAWALGADTALVGATAATSPAPVTMRGPSLDALRTEIETWAVTAASSIPAPTGSGPGIER